MARLGRMRSKEKNCRSEHLPTATAVSATISLLVDADQKIVAACRSQLLSWGDDSRPLLDEAARFGDAELRPAVRGLLRSLDLRQWSMQVQEFISDIGSTDQLDWPKLEEGALLLSAVGQRRPEQVQEFRQTLDGHAEELRDRVAGKSSTTVARLLAGYLYGQLGYSGYRSSYYQESSIDLCQVQRCRLGVPVSLSTLYLLVGRRLGLRLCGVAIPDHFLVRVHGNKPILLDPFHEGRTVTKADCVRFMRMAGYGLHTSSYLDDIGDRQVLEHLLRNLQRVYGYREDHEFCSALEMARRNLMQS